MTVPGRERASCVETLKSGQQLLIILYCCWDAPVASLDGNGIIAKILLRSKYLRAKRRRHVAYPPPSELHHVAYNMQHVGVRSCSCSRE